MVIITDANGNLLKPTIPDKVYQGSNLANEIVFLCPLPQSNEAYINFRLPNGIKTEPQLMTKYNDIPDNNLNLSAWFISLTEDITYLYGKVDYQIKLINSNGQRISTVCGSFNVEKGVLFTDVPEPSTTIWEQILIALAGINERIDGGYLESKGILPYDEEFEYSYGVFVYDLTTSSIYKSLSENNEGHELSNTSYWERTQYYTKTQIDSLLAQKQDNLVAGAGITINGTTISAKGIFYCGDRTTYEQIQEAISNGLLPVLRDGGYYYNYLYSNTETSKVYFTRLVREEAKYYIAILGGVSLIIQEIVLQQDNLTNSISSISDEEEYPSAKAVYDFVTQNFVPLSFASRLYLTKTSSTTASLEDTAPTTSASNVLSIETANTTFDWSSPAITVQRELSTAIQLNNTNSFAIDLYFDLSRNTELTFGAKIKISTDNGTTWSYISSNQSFGEKSYNNGFNTEDIVVYTDLATNETYDVGTLLAIEIFTKQEHNNTLTTEYYCGVEVDGAGVYSFVEFNFANVNINTNQIENGAVTFEKLSTEVQEEITQLATETKSGRIWCWEDEDGTHIWTIDPMEVHYTVENGVYNIKTMNYEEQNGVYTIGGNE